MPAFRSAPLAVAALLLARLAAAQATDVEAEGWNTEPDLALAAAGKPAALGFSSLQAAYEKAMEAARLWEAAALADRSVSVAASGREQTLALREAARLHAALGDARQARRDLERLVAAAPRDADAWLALARIARDEPRRALRCADRARALLNGADRAAADALAGEIELDLGQDRAARADLSRALAEGGEDLDALAAMVAAQRADPAQAALYAARAGQAASREPSWRRGAAQRLCARLWLGLGRAVEAAQSFRRALTVDADDVEALEGLVRIKREQPRALESAGGATGPTAPDADLPRPGARLMEAILDAPAWQQEDTYLAVARLWASLGDLEKAKGCIKRARELNFESLKASELMASLEAQGVRQTFFPVELGQGLQAVARARLELGQARAALDAIQRAVRYDEAAGSAALAEDERLQASIQRALGDLAGAERALERALALAPGDIGTLQDLARLKAENGAPDRALAASVRLLQALESRPGPASAEAGRLKARAQRALGDLAGAEDSYAAASRALPDDFSTLRDWVNLELFRRRASKALELLATFKPDAKGRLAGWRVLRGAALELSGDAEGARREFQSAAAEDASAACLGDSIDDRSRLGGNFFDACLERLPSEPRLYVDRGVARHAAGQDEGAIADFQKALEIEPGDSQAAESLAALRASAKGRQAP